MKHRVYRLIIDYITMQRATILSKTTTEHKSQQLMSKFVLYFYVRHFQRLRRGLDK